jgi:hypothetical protein
MISSDISKLLCVGLRYAQHQPTPAFVDWVEYVFTKPNSFSFIGYLQIPNIGLCWVSRKDAQPNLRVDSLLRKAQQNKI